MMGGVATRNMYSGYRYIINCI